MDTLKYAEEFVRRVYAAEVNEDIKSTEDMLKEEYTKIRDLYVYDNALEFVDYQDKFQLFEGIEDTTVASIRGSLSSFWGRALKNNEDVRGIDTFTLAFDWMRDKYKNYVPEPVLVRDIELVFYRYKKDYIRKIEKHRENYPDGHKDAAIYCVKLWLENDIKGLKICCEALDESSLEMLESGMGYLARKPEELTFSVHTLDRRMDELKKTVKGKIHYALDREDFDLIGLTSGRYVELVKAVRKYKKAVQQTL